MEKSQIGKELCKDLAYHSSDRSSEVGTRATFDRCGSYQVWKEKYRTQETRI